MIFYHEFGWFSAENHQFEFKGNYFALSNLDFDPIWPHMTTNWNFYLNSFDFWEFPPKIFETTFLNWFKPV